MMMPLKDQARNIRGYLKILRDRTERKLSRGALQTSEDRLRLAVDAARLGLWHCESPFKAVVVDERCKGHFGLPPEVEIATLNTINGRVHPDDRPRTTEAIDHAIAGRTPSAVKFRTST